MQPSALYNDFGALATLRFDAQQTPDDSLKEVASQFESLFLQMVLKSMRDATVDGGLFGSDQLETYEQMFDSQLSLHLSQSGGVGLADVIVRQLAQNEPANPPASAELGNGMALDKNSPPPNGLPVPEQRAPTLPQASKAEGVNPTSAMNLPFNPDTPEAFVSELLPYAEKAASRLGVSPQVLLAQSALETGWGKKTLPGPNGSSHNLFNIKASADWQGASTTQRTVEYRDGVAMTEVARFRAYDSVADAFDDYADFVSGSPRYGDALSAARAGDDRGYLNELQAAGYATDPQYADKIGAIMERPVLAESSAPEQVALKNSDDRSLSL